MPKNFVRKTFDRRLARSYSRFHYPPRLILQRKEFFILQFVGMTPKLWCYISKWGNVEIGVIYQRMWWDIMTDFDVSERRTSIGQYYCDQCDPPDMCVT